MRRVLLWLLGLSFLAGVAEVTAQDCVSCSVGISVEEILANLSPDVEINYPVDDLIYDRRYQRVNSAVEIFDAPGGNVVRTLDAGFNFVTTQSNSNEWTEINNGEWLKTENLGEAVVSRFGGVFLDELLPYPIGWILVNVRPSRIPGTEAFAEDSLLLRYTVVYLYESVEIDGWLWYQVGVDQWVHQTLIAKYLPIERPIDVDTERWVSVDLYEQVAIAYEGSTPVFTTLVSSGLEEWATPEGLFHVYVRYPRTIMSGAGGLPDFYFLEEVPWTMYFNGDVGLHGTYWHDGFGYRHSHGCVNLSIMDAKWLYDWASAEIDFSIDNDLGPAVYVYSSGEYR